MAALIDSAETLDSIHPETRILYMNAIRDRDSKFDGVFVLGMPVRKIYCTPSCKEFERDANGVVIFMTNGAAETAGYRPCLKCNPSRANRLSQKAELVSRLCDYIRSNPSSDLSLSALEVKFGVNRYSIQKAFKEIMGISPRKYVEECRIILLKRRIREGEPMPQAIYKAGYNSQSWLYEDSTSKLGMTPASYRKGGEGASISYLTSKCRLGFLMVAETAQGICSISMADRETDLVDALNREYPKATITRSESVKYRMDSVLQYFEGQLLNLPLDVEGTEFQRKVWSALLRIPYGETRSYNEIAVMIGMPKAYRAVANACAANHVPLVVPCHRVVRKDGNMGGYALGTDRKKYLLDMEKRNTGVK